MSICLSACLPVWYILPLSRPPHSFFLLAYARVVLSALSPFFPRHSPVTACGGLFYRLRENRQRDAQPWVCFIQKTWGNLVIYRLGNLGSARQALYLSTSLPTDLPTNLPIGLTHLPTDLGIYLIARMWSGRVWNSTLPR